MSTDYAPIETLEVRRLLSAVLRSNGTLAITGTTGSDTIVLTNKIVQEFQPTGIIVPVEHFVITTNGTEEADVQSYRVKRIDVSLDNGNDSFTVPSRLQTKIYADGGRGNDTITGGRNHDTLDGGLGNDSLVGNAGNDVLGSANGGDTAIGGDGFDTIDMHRRTVAVNISLDGVANDGAAGETGNIMPDIETLIGGSGADTIDASAFPFETDVVTGVRSGVWIYGNNGNNTITGSDGNDVIIGGVHQDVLHGGGGDDYLQARRGLDRVFGDDGDDTLITGDDDLRDLADGGLGTDVFYVDFLDRTRSLEIQSNPIGPPPQLA